MTVDAEHVVRAALVQVLGPERAAAAARAVDLVNEGHLDSFAMVELAAQLEASLGIIIPADQIGGPGFENVKSLSALCKSLIRR